MILLNSLANLLSKFNLPFLQYISGNRLQKPSTLEGNLASIYMIMMRCWNPFPEARDTPQAILRDLNQLLYRVFNAKKIHTYISVDDTTSEQSGSLGTLQTTAGSDDTVVYLSSNAASGVSDVPPEVPPPRKNSYESSQGSLQSFGNFSPPSGNSLVPAFNDLMKKFLKNQGMNYLILNIIRFSSYFVEFHLRGQ